MSRRTLFFSGKGGVGKTTCSMALGRVLSRQGPVTVVSLDPAHNLGDLAGMDLSGRPRRIHGDLHGWEPDLEALGRERTDRTVRLLSQGHRHLDALSLGDLPGLLRHAPGLVEQAALDALSMLATRQGGDSTVIVDMPPTGLAARMLALPALQLEWIEVLSELRRRILDRRASIAHVSGEGPGGGRALETTTDPVYAELARQREDMGSMGRMLGQEARHLLVVQPEPLSIVEASRLLDVLVSIHAGPPLLVVNRFRGAGDGMVGALGPLADLQRVTVAETEGVPDPGTLDGIGECIAGLF